MVDLRWGLYPRVGCAEYARAWLAIQANTQRAPNAVYAYARALAQYLAFSEEQHMVSDQAGQDHVAAYVRDLAERPNPRAADRPAGAEGVGLAIATMRLKLNAIRLFYDDLLGSGPPSQPGRSGTRHAGDRDRTRTPAWPHSARRDAAADSDGRRVPSHP